MILSTTPSHAHVQSRSPPTIPEIYVKNLVTDRTMGDASKGIGKRLIEFTREMVEELGIRLIRLDCWRGGEDALARYKLVLHCFNWRG